MKDEGAADLLHFGHADHPSSDGRQRTSVYSRGGQPCRRCGTRIESRKQGPDARLTWRCPKCQR
jgi:formamidopyrimidine-DNA glycosylase